MCVYAKKRFGLLVLGERRDESPPVLFPQFSLMAVSRTLKRTVA